ncbi:acyl-CoA-binding domain-containing protein 1 [Andrographis paniculata]|uniref:acyl-CoA-binding domain-containing protein 1 n=1 Tax=Andrographis paniculata TaxID=175694 RepID=UPI0021E92F90|nr:acyl-CoA-binding domain-containing protein 1 [Andrographis paniculata]
MADWQDMLQSVFIGIVFSFLLAKLFAVIFTFREENLRITRAHSPESEGEQRTVDPSLGFPEEIDPLIPGDAKSGGGSAAASEDSDSDSDDDWEGVESTELDETFSAASAFVAAMAASQGAVKVSNDVQLQLYGLYKIATEGKCSTPQPSALKMTARAKWQAWNKLGAMPAEEAMEKYIDLVTELYPSWADGATTKRKGESSSDASGAGNKGPIGPVFSTFVYEEEPGTELKMDAIHAFAREGDEGKLLECIESNVPINMKDSEGRTPLHWAVDRGHFNITALLLEKKADVNAQDDEGQTALHYAAVCERTNIAELLVKHGADVEAKDKEGDAARDLCQSSWPGLEFLSK